MKKFKQLNYIKHITVCNQNKNKSPDVFNEKLYQILKEEMIASIKHLYILSSFYDTHIIYTKPRKVLLRKANNIPHEHRSKIPLKNCKINSSIYKNFNTS